VEVGLGGAERSSGAVCGGGRGSGGCSVLSYVVPFDARRCGRRRGRVALEVLAGEPARLPRLRGLVEARLLGVHAPGIEGVRREIRAEQGEIRARSR